MDVMSPGATLRMASRAAGRFIRGRPTSRSRSRGWLWFRCWGWCWSGSWGWFWCWSRGWCWCWSRGWCWSGSRSRLRAGASLLHKVVQSRQFFLELLSSLDSFVGGDNVNNLSSDVLHELGGVERKKRLLGQPIDNARCDLDCKGLVYPSPNQVGDDTRI